MTYLRGGVCNAEYTNGELILTLNVFAEPYGLLLLHKPEGGSLHTHMEASRIDLANLATGTVEVRDRDIEVIGSWLSSAIPPRLAGDSYFTLETSEIEVGDYFYSGTLTEIRIDDSDRIYEKAIRDDDCVAAVVIPMPHESKSFGETEFGCWYTELEPAEVLDSQPLSSSFEDSVPLATSQMPTESSQATWFTPGIITIALLMLLVVLLLIRLSLQKAKAIR